MPRTPSAAPPGAFTLEIVVRPDDVDPIGHANNIVYVRWLQDIAIAHSHRVGLDWDAYQAIGAIFIVRKHGIEYFMPSLEGESLRVATWISETRGAVSLRRTLFFRHDGLVGAEAQTTWVLRDFRSGRPRRISAELAGRFNLAPPTPARPTPRPPEQTPQRERVETVSICRRRPHVEWVGHDRVEPAARREAGFGHRPLGRSRGAGRASPRRALPRCALRLARHHQGEPQNPYAYHFLGVALFETAQPEPARDAYRAALRLSPNYLGARVALSHVLRMLGDLRGAIAEAEEALRRSSGDGDALHAAGLAHAARGDNEAARKYLNAFLASNPEFESATEVRSILSTLDDAGGPVQFD